MNIFQVMFPDPLCGDLSTPTERQYILLYTRHKWVSEGMCGSFFRMAVSDKSQVP